MSVMSPMKEQDASVDDDDDSDSSPRHKEHQQHSSETVQNQSDSDADNGSWKEGWLDTAAVGIVAAGPLVGGRWAVKKALGI